MAALNTGRRNAALLVALLFVQLLLMTGSAREPGGETRILESWTVALTAPAVSVGRWFAGGFRGTIDGTRGLFAARRRNAELEAEMRRLRDELQQRREAVSENARLRRLLGMRVEGLPPSLGASVVNASLGGQAHVLVVDRGTRHGVRTDLPVVVPGAAVGRVVLAHEGRSKVLLLTDPNSGVAGVTQRGRVAGVVVGRGDGPLEMLYVPLFSDILPGDRVITSGLDGIFPRGLAIGRVLAVSEGSSGNQIIRLEAATGRVVPEEVLILLAPGGGLPDEAPPEPQPAAESPGLVEAR